MNCYNMVLEYINKNEKGIPIFIEEIKEYIIKFYDENNKEKVFNNIRTTLNRMNKEGIIEKAYKGIYYIPNENIFGQMLLGNRQVIKYKYIMDKGGNIKGYFTGAKLFNEAHLTTQVPNVIDIATNECKNHNKYKNRNLNVIIRKPRIKVNNDNYKYLQLASTILQVMSMNGHKRKTKVRVVLSVVAISSIMETIVLSPIAFSTILITTITTLVSVPRFSLRSTDH